MAAPESARGEPHVELRNVSLVYGGGDDQTLAVDRVTMQVAKANSSPWSDRRAAANPR